MKYHAFISYSHRDKAWGDWLHRALEHYAVPRALVGQTTSRGETVPARVYPVFRDREELPTAVDLGSVITDALQQSRYLIVICSPHSARSEWVNQEIVAYKRLGRENRVLAIIVDGEPNAAEGKPGFTPEQECFPRALKFKLGADGNLSAERTEPIAADARAHADGKANALLKLLAGVLGVNFDDLKRRDELARRRRQRIVVTVTTALSLVFASLAAVSVWQWRVAEARRVVSDTRLYQASIALAANALKDGRADLARAALWRAPVALRHWEWGYLLRQVYPSLAAFAVAAPGEIMGSWVTDDGTRWVVQRAEALVCARWEAGRGYVTQTIPVPRFADVDVSADGRRVLVCAGGEIAFWQLDESGAQFKEAGRAAQADWERAFFRDSAGAAWVGVSEHSWSAGDTRTGATSASVANDYTLTDLIRSPTAEIALAFSRVDGGGGLLDAHGRWLARPDAPLWGANAGAFTADGRAAALLSGDGGVWLIDVANAAAGWRQIRAQVDDLSARNRTASCAAFSPDGAKLWFISRQKLHTYERATEDLSVLDLPDGAVPSCLAVSAEQVAVGTERGEVFFFSAAGEQIVGRGLAHEGAVQRVAAWPGAPARWVSLGADGSLQVWARPSGFVDKGLGELAGFQPLPASRDLSATLAAQRPELLARVRAAHQGEVATLALDSTGERLASGGTDGEVRLWSVADGELLLSLPGPAALVFDARFGADRLQLGIMATTRGDTIEHSFVREAADWLHRPWLAERGDAKSAAAATDEPAAFAEWQRRSFLK